MKRDLNYGHLRWGMLIVAITVASPARGQSDSVPAQLANPLETSPLPIERLPPPDGIPADAAEQGLSLSDLEAIALSRNPSIARAAALVSDARGACVQAGLPPNPSLGYDGQQLGSGGQAEQHGIAFGQEIVTGGKLRLNRAVARQRIELAEQQLTAQRQKLLTDVRLAYYQALVAQRQINLAQQLIQVSNEGTRTVDSLYKAREVGRVDVLQAQLEVEQSQIALQAAQNRYEAAWRTLAAVLGEPNFTRQPLLGDPATPANEMQFDSVLSELRSRSPEVNAAFAELQRARFAVGRARAEPIPNVTVLGLVNVVDNGVGGKPDGGVAVSIPIPVFNRNQGGIAQAEREVVAAREAINQVELSLQQRLAPVYETYAVARSQVDRYRETILPAADEALKLSRQMYQAGEANYVGVLTAQRTFAQTNSNYLDAALRLRTAETLMEGLLLSGSLDGGAATDIPDTGSTAQQGSDLTPLLLNR